MQVWDSEHFAIAVPEKLPPEILPPQLSPQLPLYIASVVPQQTALFKTYPHTQVVTLDHIPLTGIYPTLGSDRALALWGAGVTYGFPCLVIDAGTALTFTAADADKRLVGGAILPGLGVQLHSLVQKTAALPEVNLPQKLPQRWAKGTPEAIVSGVIYTVIAGVRDFIEDWWQQYPDSQIVLTGGDGALLLSWLLVKDQEAGIKVDPNLVFWGMRSLI